jgi:hypothetical protein
MSWPPLFWLAIAAASLLIIVGIGGEWNPEGLIPGCLAGAADGGGRRVRTVTTRIRSGDRPR